MAKPLNWTVQMPIIGTIEGSCMKKQAYKQAHSDYGKAVGLDNHTIIMKDAYSNMCSIILDSDKYFHQGIVLFLDKLPTHVKP